MSCGFGHEAKSAPGIACLFIGVSIMLGRMELTLIPVPLLSAARESISATAAAFDAAYAAAPAPWSTAAFAATLTMDPYRCLSIGGKTARAKEYPERRLSENIASTVLVSKSQSFIPPA